MANAQLSARICVDQRSSFDLSRAATLDAAIAQCAVFLAATFAPTEAQIVWNPAAPQLLFSINYTNPLLPDPETLLVIQRGAISLGEDDTGMMSCFAPLQAQGHVQGWLYLALPHWHDNSLTQVQQFVGQAGSALTLLEATSQHSKRVAQLETLADVGRVLNGVLDLDTLLGEIYEKTRRVLDVTNFYIALYDSPTNTLETAYVVHDGEVLNLVHRWKPSEGLAQVLINERAPLLTDDYNKECERRGVRPQRIGHLVSGHAWLGVPLFANDTLVGILNINSNRSDYRYDESYVPVLATIGAQAAVAIQNARMYSQITAQARQLATLNRIGRIINSSLDPEEVPSLIMNQVCTLLNVVEGSLLLVDHDNGDLVFAYTNGPVGHQLLGQRIPAGVGVAGYVVNHAASVIVDDAQQDQRFYANTDQATGYVTRSMLAVPLRGVGGVQGVIEVMNRHDGQAFTKQDQRLLEAVADQAVIALENAQRFAQVDEALARRAKELASTNDMLEHNLRSLTALNALSMAINMSLRQPTEIFSMTASGIIEVTEASGAMVMRPQNDGFRYEVQIGNVAPSPIFEAMARTVLATGRPTTIQATADQPALLAVPLRATQRTLGVICATYSTNLPSESDQETAVLFASQSAAAVESIELFTAVRGARDQMASILASTREGIALIDTDARIAVANTSMHQLCRFVDDDIDGSSVEAFLQQWRQRSSYDADEWNTFVHDLNTVLLGNTPFASGQLNPTSPQDRAVEWSALPAHGSGDSFGGALLVLRDITEAKEIERLRADLTSMIVHDLRSPLSSLMASIEMLGKGIIGEVNPVQKNVLSIANNSAHQMLNMVNTLLDISRLESNRMPMNARVTTAQDLVTTASLRLESLAREQAITLKTELAPNLPRVEVDEEMIVRVLQNLMANAIKFSDQNTAVQITADVVADPGGTPMVCLAVHDQGVGIAPKDQDKVFGKFSQVGEKRGGSGLGLTFCKLAVEAHNGTIWLESTPGTGSTFFLTIPLARGNTII